jgi:hypothetical protein
MNILGQYLKQIQEFGYGHPKGVGLVKTRWDELTATKGSDKRSKKEKEAKEEYSNPERGSWRKSKIPLLNKDNVPLPFKRVYYNKLDKDRKLGV